MLDGMAPLAASHHWGVIAGSGLTLLSVLATLFLALVAVGALRASSDQAEDAARAVEEGRRTRIDSRAPAVFIDVADPEFPPRLESSGEGPAPRDTVLSLPGQDRVRLDVRFRCTLTNHGTTPAKVHLPGPLHHIGTAPHQAYLGEIDEPIESTTTFVLHPGVGRHAR